MIKNKVFIAGSALIVLLCSTATHAVQTTQFTASVTATVPSAFKLLTKSTNQDNENVSLNYDHIGTNGQIGFNEVRIPVKLMGSNNNDVTLTVPQDMLKLSSPGKNAYVISQIDIRNATSDSLVDTISIGNPSITITETDIDYSDFIIGVAAEQVDSDGKTPKAGVYSGNIIITASQNI